MKKELTMFSGSALLLIATTLAAPVPTFAQGSSHAGKGEKAPAGGGPIAIRTQLVSLTVTVTDDRGRYVPGLEKTDFSVFEDGLAQEISFFRADDAPATVGVIFDLSGSMSGVKIERAKDALTRFFQNSHPDDEYSIVGFSDRPRVLLKRAHDAEPVVDGVSRMSPRGATALYDAIDTGLEQVTRGAWNKRALIVISDGQDNHSRTSLKALKRTVAESGVIVYCVLIKDLLPFHQGDELRELSESSGGLSFSPSSADHMSEAFDRIAVDLRRRYSIGYTPSNFSADDRWRRLKVKVLSLPGAPRLIANTRKGYFATAGGSRRGLPETLGGGAR